VRDRAHPGLATAHGLAFRHPQGGIHLRGHAFDLLGATIVVTGVDHGLLLGHRR
jgi:hypothetical protein